MPQNSNSGSLQRKRFKILAEQLVVANTHLYFFRELKKAKGNHPDEWFESPAFWALTLRAHLQIALLKVCCVFDYRPDSSGLSGLLANLPKEVLSPEQRGFLKADKQYCGHQSPPDEVKSLRAWRHQVVAHHNDDLIIQGIDEFQKKWPFQIEDIQKAIDEGFGILERWQPFIGESMPCERFLKEKENYRFIFESLRQSWVRKAGSATYGLPRSESGL